MYSWSSKDQLVICVVDQSISMNSYRPLLLEECLKLQQDYSLPTSPRSIHFIAFADIDNLKDSSDIRDLQDITGTTKIAQAFERAIKVCNEKTGFKRVTLLFVSDGEDNEPVACKAEIARLRGKMPCPCELICVGCRGFPTDFARGPLFSIFGGANRRTVAPVVPCPYADDVPYVFSVVREMLESSRELSIPTDAELDALEDPPAIVKAGQVLYNVAVNDSMYFQRASELVAFGKCRDQLEGLLQKLTAKVREVKRGPAAPLFSAEVRKLDVAQSVEIVQRLHRKAGECLRMAQTGKRISDLSDQMKLDIAGMASNLGALTGKVLKYHLPDAVKIQDSFVRALRSYPGVEEDKGVVASGGASLYDSYQDAKSVVHYVDQPGFTIYSMVQLFSFLGCPMKIAKRTPGAEMNSWLLEVEDFCYSEVQTMQQLLGDEEREWNCMLLVPSKREHNMSYLKYAQSCVLTTEYDEHPSEFNGCVFHNEGWWAVLAASVEFWLRDLYVAKSPSSAALVPIFGSSRIGVDEAFREFFSLVYPGVKDYLYKMEDDSEFRECFVAGHPALGKFMTCPHLTKPLFAIWYNLSDPCVPAKVPLDDQKLRRRFLAFLVEFFHRSGQKLVWTPTLFLKTPEEILSTADFQGVFLNCYKYGSTLPKALHHAWPVITVALEKVKAVMKENPQAFFNLPSIDEGALGLAKHYQFTLQSIKDAFFGVSCCPRYGMDAEFSTIVPQKMLARLLLVAQTRDNLQRNRDPSFDRPLTEEEFKQLACREPVAALMDLVATKAREEFVSSYRAERESNHSDPPVLFDVATVTVWGLDNGRDALRVLDIDPATGLSRNFCACPSCFYCLKPIGANNMPGYISPALKGHLENLAEVPGLHKAIAKHPRLSGEGELCYAKRIVRLLRGGAQLSHVHPSAEKIQRRIDILQADARFPAPYGASARERIAKLKEKLESYAEHTCLKFASEFPDDGAVEFAVIKVLRSNKLGYAETRELLDKMKSCFPPFKPNHP